MERIGQDLIKRLDGTASLQECNATANYMTLYVGKLSTELLHGLYSAIKNQKNGKRAIRIIEENKDLRTLLTAEPSGRKKESLKDRFASAMLTNGVSAKEVEVKLKSCYTLTLDDLPAVAPKCPAEFIAWLLTVHETQIGSSGKVTAACKKPGLCPEAAKAVALLNPDSFQRALRRYQYY